jgi:hypothetical protein
MRINDKTKIFLGIAALALVFAAGFRIITLKFKDDE